MLSLSGPRPQSAWSSGRLRAPCWTLDRRYDRIPRSSPPRSSLEAIPYVKEKQGKVDAGGASVESSQLGLLQQSQAWRRFLTSKDKQGKVDTGGASVESSTALVSWVCFNRVGSAVSTPRTSKITRLFFTYCSLLGLAVVSSQQVVRMKLLRYVLSTPS